MQEQMTPEQLKAAVAKGFRSGGRKRHKPGEMNRTEALMAQELELELKAGLILWWSFESITLKIGADCRLTVDFAILHCDGSLEFRDAKGHVEDDYLVKMKAAAEKFWMFRFTHYQRKGGTWTPRIFS